MAKYHVKKDGTPGLCKAQEGNCPLGDSSQHFSTIQDAQDYADKINEEKAELSSMNTEEVKNRALEDNENGDKYRTELYNRLSNNTERKEFKLKEMKGNDFNEWQSKEILKGIKQGLDVKSCARWLVHTSTIPFPHN